MGVGWSDVLELKAIGQVDAGGDFNLGLGHIVCIQVPIYSVFKPEWGLLPDEGERLHPLISNSASHIHLVVWSRMKARPHE